MAPIVPNFHPFADSIDSEVFDCETQVTGVKRNDAHLHPRTEPGDTSSDQNISTIGIIGVLVVVLIAFGILAWLCYSTCFVEQRRAKERNDDRRKRMNAQQKNEQPKRQANVNPNKQENVNLHRQEDVKPARPEQQPKRGILKKGGKVKKVAFNLPPSSRNARHG
jgi:flagellar biosynthesis/type III secretory pathway M-ring protein FliF/YscJ